MRWLLLLVALLVPSPVAGAVARAFAVAAPSVVMVLGSDGGSGSGVVVAPGQVLTCAHVVLRRSRSTFSVAAGTRRLPAEVIKIDGAADLALLSVPGLLAPPAAIAASDPPEMSELYTVGFPAGMRCPARS